MQGSPVLRFSFAALTLLLFAGFVLAVHRSALRSGVERGVAATQAAWAATGAGIWLALTGLLAARGLLQFESPPTMAAPLLLTLVLAVGITRSPLGLQLATGLPLAVLVGFQAFRIAVEMLLHRAYTEGLMPVQMSWSGRNFDVVSGVTAVALGLWLATGPRRHARAAAMAWNVLGTVLLVNILIIAILSAPVPFRVFMNEPANTWVTRAPWIWLPTVMVLAALLGHLLLFRRLAASRSDP